MKELLATSARLQVPVEALTTVAPAAMPEIIRVASLHQCRSVVMGLSQISDDENIQQMEQLLAAIDLDVVILRAPPGWKLASATRILVPVAGRGGHPYLMSSVLGSLSRKTHRDVAYLRVVKPGSSPAGMQRKARRLRGLAEDQLLAEADIRVIPHADAAAAIAGQAADFDLLVLGATRSGRHEKIIGGFTAQVARLTDCPLLVLSSRTPTTSGDW
jgi:nucleotide-binding universal stress UspA family protein